MTPAAHSSSAIFVELGLALFLKGGSRGLEERTGTVRTGRPVAGREPGTHRSRKCERIWQGPAVGAQFFHRGLISGRHNNFICSRFRTRSAAHESKHPLLTPPDSAQSSVSISTTTQH